MTETGTTAAVRPAGPGGAAPLVAVTNLRVSFPKAGVDAVRGVSLAVHPGECVAIVGESGSGPHTR